MPRFPSLLALSAFLFVPSARAAAPTPTDFFEKQVRPLLVEHCLECHGDKKPRGGLRLTSRAHALKGGDSGPAAVPGKPNDSLLIQALRYTDTPRMPPKQKLADRDIAILTRWVQLGLPWPEAGAKPLTPAGTFRITAAQRNFWAFQPLAPVAPPRVKDERWPRSPLDRFILAGLEARGLRPAQQADRRTLIRRATFDLTGLPPTPAEVDAFLADRSPNAFAKVVDRLLASPAYGERYGRHWLDLVRYTDSFDARGLGGEMDCADAWRYKDWVVQALNRDLPYDRFLTDQIAGDLFPGPDGGLNRDGIVATGMLALGNWGGGDADKEKLLTDIADDQLDVVTRTFLGLTVACARCHDHKFDPISTADYYALAGIFFSTHILPNVGPKTNGPPMLRIPLLSAGDLARRNAHQQRLAASAKGLQAARKSAYEQQARALLLQTAKYVVAAWEHQQAPAGTLEQFAERRGLRPYALRQWGDYLGMGEYQLMAQRMRNVRGNAGVHGWRGAPDCPSALVNTTAKEVAILTFKLPPRSVAVHPGPNNGVVVAWRSPINGKVRVRGGLTDADPRGGDGVAWIIDHNKGGARSELASGDFPNGGAQRFERGKGAGRLDSIEVKAGDRLELLVLPRANYVCDTTIVDLTIALIDGSKTWTLASDMVADPLQGNPHADGQGNADTWHFLDMAQSRRAQRPGGAGASLAGWDRAVAAVRAGKGDRKTIEVSAAELAKSFTLADARSPFWINKSADERFLPPATRATLARLAAEQEALRKVAFPPPDFANGAQEGGVPGSPHAGTHDVRIHVRGRYDRLGPIVPRRFPEILAGAKQTPLTKGSGRRELAQWLTRPDHPLTARVMVNRLWQWHFGEGLVRTPSNFGSLGERPTHPELLDHLASELIRSGWSMKRMHRLIMLSATYQQASEAGHGTIEADPDNRWLARMSRRRLEAEEVRDALLAVSGRLDRTMKGPATRSFTAPRRTLYLMTIRSDRSGFGPLFDSADSTAPVEKRTVSTVAPQALFLMNNPFAVEQARALAGRLVASGANDRERIKRAYELLYGRRPLAEELAIGLGLLSASAGPLEKAWREYCQVLLCANEFVYVD